MEQRKGECSGNAVAEDCDEPFANNLTRNAVEVELGGVDLAVRRSDNNNTGFEGILGKYLFGPSKHSEVLI